MTFFWTFVELFATGFENFIILKTLEDIFDHRACGRQRHVITFTILFLITGYVTLGSIFPNLAGIWDLGTIFLFEICTFIFIKGKNYLKILIPIILFSGILEINILVTYVMGLILGQPDTFVYAGYDGTRLFAIFLTKLLFVIFANILVRIVKKNFNLKNKETFIITAVFLLTMIASICVIKLQIVLQKENPMSFVAILCILLVDFFVFIIVRRISKENKNKLKIAMLEARISEQREMIEDTANIGCEIKKTEHDLKHHLFSVLGMLQTGAEAEAENYLQNLLKEYQTNIFKYVFIENSALSSILNMKISRCHMSHIDIKVEVESEFNDFKDIDLCVLMSNLLDNAIEASYAVTEPKITVLIRNDRNYLNICIRNRIDQSVLQNNKDLRTSKYDKEKHGYGMYSIQQIVEKYEGMNCFYEEKGYFVADIWLKRGILPNSTK